MSSTPSSSVYCTNCGEQIDVNARYCPGCGEEQSSDDAPETDHRQQPSQRTNRDRKNATHEDIGLVFAFVDSWKRQRALRHIFNIVLIFVSVGTYLVVLLVEGLIHYHNLKSGKSHPYKERQDQKVWTTFSSLD